MRDRLNRMSTKTGSPLNKFSTDGGWLPFILATKKKLMKQLNILIGIKYKKVFVTKLRRKLLSSIFK